MSVAGLITRHRDGPTQPIESRLPPTIFLSIPSDIRGEVIDAALRLRRFLAIDVMYITEAEVKSVVIQYATLLT
jgi:hypothetical protein